MSTQERGEGVGTHGQLVMGTCELSQVVGQKKSYWAKAGPKKIQHTQDPDLIIRFRNVHVFKESEKPV